MNRLEEFRSAMHAAGAHSEIPSLQAILRRESVLQFRWAAAAMVVIGLCSVPIYRDAQQRTQEQADAMLMEKVNAALSRSVPRALSPLMGAMRQGPLAYARGSATGADTLPVAEPRP